MRGSLSFFPYTQVFFNVLIFNVWLPIGEEEKNEAGGGGKGHWPFRSTEVTSGMGGRGLQLCRKVHQQWLPIPACPLVVRSSSQWPELRSPPFGLGRQGPSRPPSPSPAVRLLLQEPAASSLESPSLNPFLFVKQLDLHCASYMHGSASAL